MSRLTLRLTKDADDRLTKLAEREGITKSEAIRRALGLLAIAESEKEKGNTLGIVREDNHEFVGRVVGI